MKKVYISPLMESTEVFMCGVVMGVSDGPTTDTGSGQGSSPSEPTPGQFGAPRRTPAF